MGLDEDVREARRKAVREVIPFGESLDKTVADAVEYERLLDKIVDAVVEAG